MVPEIKEVLRLLMLMAKQNKSKCFENIGGLLVLICTETDPNVQCFNCTVAASGPWCAGIQMQELHPVFTDLLNRLCPSPGSCPEPDIEDLCAFTDLHGPLNVFLSFQISSPDIVRPKWHHQIETFFHTFSLTNAGIKVQLKLRIHPKSFQREYRVKEYIRVPLSGHRLLSLDVSVKTTHRKSSKNGPRCYGGHPDIGESILLSIPPKAMEQGLFGTVTLQPVSLLSPCVLQYPNAGTDLSHIKVLIYSPSNVPVTSPSAFMQNLPAHLNFREVGLQSDRLSFQEVIPSGGTVYKVDCPEASEESNLFSIDQSLMLFLFLQHTDPFMAEIADIMATETLLEHHLEDILIYNRQAVTNAVMNELKKTLSVQNIKKKDKEKMHSACDEILSAALSIISCSGNMEFRNTCLNSMKVHHTRQLSVAISESLRKNIFCKFVPKRMCSSDQIGRQLGNYKNMRVEM